MWVLDLIETYMIIKRVVLTTLSFIKSSCISYFRWSITILNLHEFLVSPQIGPPMFRLPFFVLFLLHTSGRYFQHNMHYKKNAYFIPKSVWFSARLCALCRGEIKPNTINGLNYSSSKEFSTRTSTMRKNFLPMWIHKPRYLLVASSKTIIYQTQSIRHDNRAGWGWVLAFPFPFPTPIYLSVTLPISKGMRNWISSPSPMGSGIPASSPSPSESIFFNKKSFFKL